MRKLPLFLLLPLFLSACVHYEWVKDKGDPSTFGKDNYACTQEAMMAAPPTFQTTPDMLLKPAPNLVREVCQKGPRGTKRCTTEVISSAPQPQPYEKNYDLNKRNRDDYYAACMGAKGWHYVAVEDPKPSE